MYAIATFIVVAVISLAFTQVASGALMTTGLTADVATFQARSAFTGAGFTTTEAERVINHPVRRKIISTTMFVGNLGTPTLIVTVLVGMLTPGPGTRTERALVAFGGLLLVILLVSRKPVRQLCTWIGERYAQRRLLPHLADDVIELYNVSEDYAIGSVRVVDRSESMLRTLRGLDDALPKVRVLGLWRGEEYFGEPPVDVELDEGDQLIVYGRRERLEHLSES